MESGDFTDGSAESRIKEFPFQQLWGGFWMGVIVCFFLGLVPDFFWGKLPKKWGNAGKSKQQVIVNK